MNKGMHRNTVVGLGLRHSRLGIKAKYEKVAPLPGPLPILLSQNAEREERAERLAKSYPRPFVTGVRRVSSCTLCTLNKAPDNFSIANISGSKARRNAPGTVAQRLTLHPTFSHD